MVSSYNYRRINKLTQTQPHEKLVLQAMSKSEMTLLTLSEL